MIKKHSVFIILSAVFLISVFIRLNQITPTVKSHEQTYILTLQTSEIWRNSGMLNCHLTPMWTYGNPGDKYIAYYKRLEDSKGDNYYVSFPPLSFIVAHLALYPFNIEYGKLVLQILNLLLHFLSAFTIYLIICSLCKQRSDKLFLPAFISFIVYSFLPVMLFFHTDIFFPEMLGQVLWIVSIYFVLKYKDNKNAESFFTLFFVLFLFLYSEWIAVFFVITLCIYLFFSKKEKTNKLILITSITALFSAGFIMFIQYSSIAGISEMLHSMGLRFLERSGFFGQKYSSMGVHILSLGSLKLFAFNLNKALTIFGYLIIVISLLLFFKKDNSVLTSDIKFVLVLSIFPILIHWIAFFNANAIHLLLMSRIAVPISILTGVILYSLMCKYKNNLYFKILTFFIIIFFTVYSAFLYKKKFTFCENYPDLRVIAETIKKTAKPDQSVFITCNTDILEAEKYLTFITKRNIVKVSNNENVKEFMKKVNKKEDAIVFHINDKEIKSEVLFFNACNKN